MPLISQSQIVGGGANLLAPVTVGTIPMVVDVGPPGALSDSLARQFTDGAVQVVTIGPVDPRTGVGATESFRLAGGFITTGAAVDSTIIGRGAAAALGGTDGIAIGRGASVGAAAVEGIAIGRGASAAGAPAIAIGAGASAPNNSNIVIGGVVTNAASAIAIGFGSVAQSNGGSPQVIALGTSATAGSTTTGGVLAIAIGNSSIARRNDLVIGSGSTSSANTTDNNNLYIGHGITGNISAGGNLAIGNFTNITAGTNNVFIGRSSGGSGSQNIILGHGTSTASSNICLIGAASTDIRTVLIGAGGSIASPAARVLRFTDATGSNNAAGNFTIQSPRSTGNATPAQFIVQVTTVGASGAALQTFRDALSLTDTVTAGQTALSIYDVDSAALARVLVGAAGTGPGGVGRALYLA